MVFYARAATSAVHVRLRFRALSQQKSENSQCQQESPHCQQKTSSQICYRLLDRVVLHILAIMAASMCGRRSGAVMVLNVHIATSAGLARFGPPSLPKTGKLKKTRKMDQYRLAPSVILSLARLLVSSTRKSLAARMEIVAIGAIFAPGLDAIRLRDKRRQRRVRHRRGQTVSLSTHHNHRDGGVIGSPRRHRVALLQSLQLPLHHRVASQSPTPIELFSSRPATVLRLHSAGFEFRICNVSSEGYTL